MVQKMNYMCVLMQRNVDMELEVEQYDNNEGIWIKVLNYEDGFVYKWKIEKFKGRLLLMSEMVQDREFNMNSRVDKVEDPLWDVACTECIGRGMLTLVNIPYRLTQTYSIDLLTIDSHNFATLSLSITPLHTIKHNIIHNPYT